MRLPVVAERNEVGYDCRDLCMVHGCLGLIIYLSIDVRGHIDSYGFAQFVFRCTLDHVAA